MSPCALGSGHGRWGTAFTNEDVPQHNLESRLDSYLSKDNSLTIKLQLYRIPARRGAVKRYVCLPWCNSIVSWKLLSVN
jgi:hypothetical protein